MFVLTADAGHTRIKLAICAKVDALPEVVSTYFADNADDVDWDCLSQSANHLPFNMAEVRAIVTGSNHPQVRRLCEQWPKAWKPPHCLFDNTEVPISIDVDIPAKVGIDRLLNGVAVNVIRPAHAPAIIVDTGTAVTVDYLAGSGAFSGGAILPGLRLSATALHEYTTSLPLFDARKLLDQAPSVLGKNTEAAIASGLYWGHLGAITEIVQQLRSLTETPAEVFITGGAHAALAEALPFPTRVYPFLACQGLAMTLLARDVS